MNKTDKILEKLGIAELNEMQKEAVEAILHHRNDVIILSPTGSGKTLAYLLPLVQLLDEKDDSVQALVVVPGRELALQSDRVLKSMGAGLRSQSCYGGRTAMDEHKVLRQNRPQLVFGTPGRLNDHLDKGNIDAQHIKFLVKHNQAEGLKDAYVDGTWWAYGTVEGFSKLYPYMGKSSKPVRAAIDSLIDHGLIRREEHSSCHWDHTSWYCLTRKGAEACGYAPDGSEPEPQKRDCCEKPKVANKYADECYEVIEYLRQVSGRKVEHCESNYRPIRSLLSDRNPATVEQMKIVIDSKSK
jgi:hypothetical protein